MNKADIEIAKKLWLEENWPAGKLFGYPDCCVQEFCDQPPEVLKHTKLTPIDKIRFEASHVNGIYSGFIPCHFHAMLIKAGHITLESLISGRDPLLPAFLDNLTGKSFYGPETDIPSGTPIIIE